MMFYPSHMLHDIGDTDGFLEDDLDEDFTLEDFLGTSDEPNEKLKDLMKDVRTEAPPPQWIVFQKDTGRSLILPVDSLDSISEAPDGFRVITKAGKEYQINGSLKDILNILERTSK